MYFEGPKFQTMVHVRKKTVDIIAAPKQKKILICLLNQNENSTTQTGTAFSIVRKIIELLTNEEISRANLKIIECDDANSNTSMNNGFNYISSYLNRISKHHSTGLYDMIIEQK